MTLVRFIGSADVRRVHEDDFAAEGIIQDTVVFNRSNNYIVDLPPPAATMLIAMADFDEANGVPFSDMASMSPAKKGGIPLRPKAFRNLAERWRESEDPANAAPVKIAILGDSIVGQNGAGSMANALSLVLNRQQADQGSMGLAVRSSGGGTTGAHLGTGGQGVTLAAGQKRLMSLSPSGKRVSVVYTTEASTDGEITVRNGAGGAVLGVIDPEDESDSPGQIWTSGAVTVNAAIEVENTGTDPVTVEQVAVHDFNFAEGCQVWDISKIGWIASDYTNNPGTWEPFLENLQPDITIVELGTNGLANYENLLVALREALPDTLLVATVCYMNSAYTWAEVSQQRAINDSHADVSVDLAAIYGRGRTLDGVHPDPTFSAQMAKTIAAYVGGDPMYAMTRQMSQETIFGSGLALGDTIYALPDLATQRIDWGDLGMLFGGPPSVVQSMRATMLAEGAEPAAPPAGRAILYLTSAGLFVKFPTGAAIELAAKP